MFVVFVFRNFSAEGGCFLKPAGKSTWESQIPEGSDMQWRKKVMEVKCHKYILLIPPLDLDLDGAMLLTTPVFSSL